MAEDRADVPLGVLHDLLTPGLNLHLAQNPSVQGYLVPTFHSYTMDLVLWAHPDIGANGQLLSAQEIRNGEYKSLFAPRIANAVKRIQNLADKARS